MFDPRLARSDWQFSMKVVGPIMLATWLVLSLTAYGIFWAAERGDEASVARQVRMAEMNIAGSVARLAHEVETVAVWNDAVERSSPGGLDVAWLDENIGIWSHRMFGHDRVIVLDGADSPVYAMADGAKVGLERYGEIKSDVAALVADVRRATAAPQEPMAGRSTGRAVHASGLVRAAGRPAAVSVMRIVPHADDGPAAPKGREALLMSVRFLDGSFLNELRDEDLIENARILAAPEAGYAEIAAPLSDSHGERMGFLVWRPETTGSQVVAWLGPLYAMMAVCVVGLMAYLMRVLFKSSTELQASEAQAHHLAFHDVLTGQPNRAGLLQALDRSLRQAERGEGRFALLLLDLDRFKHVNDTLGHQAGDELIREFAGRLASQLRRGDMVARLGGDEFAIIQLAVGREADTEALCHRILDCARRSFTLTGGVQANIGVSIGIALAPDEGLDGGGLMRKADIALYQAKGAGRNGFRFFRRGMDEAERERARLEGDLRTTLDGGEGLTVHFQPRMTMDGGDLAGLEALVRWEHPALGLLGPDRFLAMAEDCGLAVRIDDWVLDCVCAALPRLPDVPVAVNLSPAQFASRDSVQRIGAIVRRHGADPRRIELEITERALSDGNSGCADIIESLRRDGFRIVLDDFGTGHSSLGCLRLFVVDGLKIDRTLVQHLGRAATAEPIVRAIATLGRALGLTVTAEGVETSAQLDVLQRVGCDQAQGFLFSPPVPEARLAAAVLAASAPA